MFNMLSIYDDYREFTAKKGRKVRFSFNHLGALFVEIYKKDMRTISVDFILEGSKITSLKNALSAHSILNLKDDVTTTTRYVDYYSDTMDVKISNSSVKFSIEKTLIDGKSKRKKSVELNFDDVNSIIAYIAEYEGDLFE